MRWRCQQKVVPFSMGHESSVEGRYFNDFTQVVGGSMSVVKLVIFVLLKDAAP